MSDEMVPLLRLGRGVTRWEDHLAFEQANGDVERTLFVQLAPYELALVQYGLHWIARLYGAAAVAHLINKLNDLIDAQQFCNCEDCQRRREEQE